MKCGGVADRAGHDAVGDDVDRRSLTASAAATTGPGRLEPDQAAGGRGDADRPAAVVGVGDRHDPRGDERGRSARRRAGGVAGVPRVAGRRQRLVLGRGVEPELGHGRLAEHGQPVDRNCSVNSSCARPAVRDLTASEPWSRGQAGEVGVVLDEGRDAGERPPAQACPRRGQPALEVGVLDRVERRVDPGDAGEGRLGGLACADGRRQAMAAATPTESRSPSASSPKAWTRVTSRCSRE